MNEGKIPDDQYIERPVDPTRKRYYLVDDDILHATSDLELLNEDELLGPASPSGCREVLVFAGRDAGSREMCVAHRH